MLAEGVDEGIEVLANVVQRDLVEAKAGQLVEPLDVAAQVGRDEDSLADVVRRDSLASSSNCSGVSRSQQAGGGKTFVRHCSWAMRRASSVGAQERCTWSTRRPLPPPSRNASSKVRRWSRGALTVARPSAHEPAQRAVSTDTAAPMRGGGSDGRVHSRARSTTTRPRWLTSSPSKSARMTSTHSRSRALRSGLGGHGPPVMCSLEFSPVPRATQSRPGNISLKEAAAWAMIAGW